jgi:hypothetical protein
MTMKAKKTKWIKTDANTYILQSSQDLKALTKAINEAQGK